MKLTKLVLLSFVLLSCKSNDEVVNKGSWNNIVSAKVKNSYGNDVDAFNTVMRLSYFIDENLSNKDKVLDDVKEIYTSSIYDLHKKFDRHYSYYEDDNETFVKNIRSINNSLDKNTPVKVSKETYELLKTGVEFTKLTDGYFNIFVGDVIEFWDEVFDNACNFNDISYDPYFNEAQRAKLEKLVACVPLADEIDEVLKFNDATYEVTFSSIKDRFFNGEALDDLSISVGGIAKGYATDIVKEKLVSNNYTRGYLFSGASSIASLAKPIFNNNKGQEISIVDPRNQFSGKYAFKIYFDKEFAMSTSGNYTMGKSYRLTTNDGKFINRHHIINPKTGYPEDNFASVTLASNSLSAGALDALSTAFVNLNFEEGMKLKEKVEKTFEKDLKIVYVQQDYVKETINVISTSRFDGKIVFSSEEGITYEYQ